MDQLAAKAGIEMAFGDGHAHGIGNTLTQRTSGGFDAGQMAMLRMAGAGAANFAEIFDVLQGDARIAGEPEQRIKQHRAMTGRQHKPVAVGPIGIGGVEFEEAAEQYCGGIGHAQGEAGMAGFGSFHRVHRKGADGIGEQPNFGLLRQIFGAWHIGFPFGSGEALRGG